MESRNKLDEVVRARVRSEHKRAMRALAQARDMDESDILREAVRFYLFHHTLPPAPPEIAAMPTKELVDA